MVRRPSTALLLALLVALAAGCGTASSGSDSRPDQDARLLLDFAPNAVHAGIYLALQRGYDEAEGVRLDVETPGTSTDGIESVVSGHDDLAIVDIHDLAIARAKGKDVVGVMAIVQTPLAAVLAQPGITRPRDLEGRKAGVTGLPSDDAVLDSIVAGDGGDPTKVRKVTVGFDAVPALLSRKVAGATAFWNAEGVALAAKRPGVHEFRVDDFGAPSYPELVLVTSRETLETSAPVVRATIRALRRGYEGAINDPESAVSALTDAEPSLKRVLTLKELDAVSPSFTAGADFYGELNPATLAKWATWEQRFGIVKRKPDVATMFDPATARTGLKDDPDA
ncbi:ABC transporter substrate-binding protein [Baekduia sp.]|jgi:ABC-type nitrate/sulfonate/bicarbonate transport system substrate-binding protein|uniref:ABC transporter substrate-binding protein n=1 Tax=Baekduia sp. TaxID=2600305 RepID=UPI002E0209B2|nr:ABC transporter substrate-binding protein [Baekduia sp.]